MIYWVFGGSCVGKKYFIRKAIESPERFGLPALKSVWFADGDMTPEELISASKEGPIIVRWQWGRETALKGVAKLNPEIRQTIYLCKVYPSVQVKRMLAREGSMKFDEHALIREVEEVQFLVEKLSMAHGIPVRYVDANS